MTAAYTALAWRHEVKIRTAKQKPTAVVILVCSKNVASFYVTYLFAGLNPLSA